MDGADAGGVVTAIQRRRSMRDGFATTPVPPGVLAEIVACGQAAPSSKNARPWRMYPVSDAALTRRLADAVATAAGADQYVPRDPRTGRPRDYSSTVVASADVLRGAPAAIWISNTGPFSGGRQAIAAARGEALAGSLVGYGFELMGLGAAVENMWLAAEALGLGASFLGDVVIAEEHICTAIGAEGDLVGVLALGYAGDRARS